MFKKALAHQSNATPLRSSARRQLVASAFTQYPAFLDSVSTDAAGSDSVTAAKGDKPNADAGASTKTGKTGSDAGANAGPSEKDIGRAVMPEGLRSCSFETSAGNEGTMYLTSDGDPMWFSLRGSKELIPTLYALSQPLPTPPLPTLQLHYPLPPPLLGGAALFLPAVRHLGEPWRLPDVAQGDIVALVADTQGDGTVSYVGVGRVVAPGGLAAARESLLRHRMGGTDEREGKFCDIMGIVDDRLWELGSKPAMPSFPLPAPRKPLVAPPVDPAADAAAGIANLAVSESEAGETEEEPADASATQVPDSGPLSPAEVSTLLTAALLQALSSLPTDSSSGATPAVSFPIPASQLYSGLILPSRPAYIPRARRDDVVIGRSEWRKLARWMKEVSKEGLVRVKESKGEATIVSYDPSHASLQAHAPFLTIAEEEARAAKRAARVAAAAEAEATPAGKTGARTMVIEELWRPAGAGLEFWGSCGVEPDSLNKPSSMKTLFDTYITANNLISSADHRRVSLDATLLEAVGTKSDAVGSQVARDEVLRRLRSNVKWSVSVGGVVKKSLNPITMGVKTRQGRKTVTIVSGLEAFGVDIDDFAEELRKTCAGSTSISPLTGASPKLNLKEVLVQGSQTKAVTEALLARGVPKRWIKEEADKKKR